MSDNKFNCSLQEFPRRTLSTTHTATTPAPRAMLPSDQSHGSTTTSGRHGNPPVT